MGYIDFISSPIVDLLMQGIGGVLILLLLLIWWSIRQNNRTFSCEQSVSKETLSNIIRLSGRGGHH